MNQSPEVNEIATALSAFQADVTVIMKSHKATIKTKTGADYSYDYADLADTVEAAAPKLAALGLSVTQMPGWEDGYDVLTTRVLHKSGQWMEGTMRLFLASSDPRGHGSAITYARRYAYCSALGIVADKDDDGAAASPPQTVRGHTVKPQVQRRPPPVVQLVQLDPKRQLLAACAGDKDLAARLWSEAFADKAPGAEDLLNETELKLLLSRAQAEVDGGPFE